MKRISRDGSTETALPRRQLFRLAGLAGALGVAAPLLAGRRSGETEGGEGGEEGGLGEEGGEGEEDD